MAQLALSFEESSLGEPFAGALERLVGSSAGAWPDAFGRAIREATCAESIASLSLFSGAGGLDIGFHDAGFEIQDAVELEERFAASLSANSGSGGYLEGMNPRCIDIRDYDPPGELRAELIIGGPPCQTFSAAGRRASGVKGTDDPRGTLFLEYVRILEALKPQAFVFENVYGIVGAQGGEPWSEIRRSFSEIGYKLFWRILDAADYGAPQHRERLIIVGTRDREFLFPRPTHGPDSPDSAPYYSAREAVSGLEAPGTGEGLSGRYGHLLSEIPPGLNYSFFTARMGHPNPVFAWRSKFSDFLYKADPDLPVRTIKAQGGQYTGPFSWENRPFTVSELKRLQTFPDAYEIVGGRGAAIHQIGNSVPPQFARILALSIREQLFDKEIPLELSYLDPSEKLGFRSRKRLLTARYEAKAAEALATRNEEIPSPGIDALPPRFTRWTDDSFRWTHESRDGSVPIEVKVKVEPDFWQVGVTERGWRGNPSFHIEVSPSVGKTWSAPIDRVILSSQTLSPLGFFACWRAFGELLSLTTDVADLVQLNGYYQYESALSARMELKAGTAPEPFWQVVQRVVSGSGVGFTAPAADFVNAWEIDGLKGSDVKPILGELRRAGFEVRGNGTNPQIKEGEFLIPYPFPTLTPMSVQLRKTL